jgi:hypothetical protein
MSLGKRGAWNLRPSGLAAVLVGLVLAVPVGAVAAQLIVNNVSIGKVDLAVQGLEGITFEKCTWVKIEANGDVKVDCPGYDLQAAAPAAAEPAKGVDLVPGRITKRYWIVTEQKEKGGTQFDVDLYVNSKWIKRFKNDDEQLVFEITKHLVPGKNKLLFAATKNVADGRKGQSPAVFYRFVVGEGEVGGGNVMIDNPIIDLKRTAAEAENVTEERELLAR